MVLVKIDELNIDPLVIAIVVLKVLVTGCMQNVKNLKLEKSDDSTSETKARLNMELGMSAIASSSGRMASVNGGMPTTTSETPPSDRM